MGRRKKMHVQDLAYFARHSSGQDLHAWSVEAVSFFAAEWWAEFQRSDKSVPIAERMERAAAAAKPSLTTPCASSDASQCALSNDCSGVLSIDIEPEEVLENGCGSNCCAKLHREV